MTVLYPSAYVLRVRASRIDVAGDVARNAVLWTVVYIGTFTELRQAYEWRQDFQVVQREFDIKSRCQLFTIWPTRTVMSDFDPREEDGWPDSVADALQQVINANHLERLENKAGIAHRHPQYV